jgi:hypothetical protein
MDRADVAVIKLESRAKAAPWIKIIRVAKVAARAQNTIPPADRQVWIKNFLGFSLRLLDFLASISIHIQTVAGTNTNTDATGQKKYAEVSNWGRTIPGKTKETAVAWTSVKIHQRGFWLVDFKEAYIILLKLNIFSLVIR